MDMNLVVCPDIKISEINVKYHLSHALPLVLSIILSILFYGNKDLTVSCLLSAGYLFTSSQSLSGRCVGCIGIV